MAPASTGSGGKTGQGKLRFYPPPSRFAEWTDTNGGFRTAKLDEVTSLLDALKLDLKDKKLKGSRKCFCACEDELR
jgi:hypothetical protein